MDGDIPTYLKLVFVLMVGDGIERWRGANWVSFGLGREFRAACTTGMQLRDKKRMFPNGRQDKKGFIFGLLLFRY